MRRLMLRSALPVTTLILAFSCPNANAQAQLSLEMQQKIDKVAHDALAKTGVPSASVAIVKDGQIAYLHAYPGKFMILETRKASLWYKSVVYADLKPKTRPSLART